MAGKIKSETIYIKNFYIINMKEIKVNNLEELLAEVKKYVDTYPILTQNVYRIFNK